MIIEGDKKLIAAAFIKARAEIGGTVTEDAKGNFGKYVTLAAIAKATTGILAKHGLAIIQEAELHEGGVTIETHLLHESGATMQFSPLTMPLSKRDAQGVGSAISYGRRYQWMAVCGLASDDDDGQQATDAQRKAQQQRDTSGQISPMERDVALWEPNAGKPPVATNVLSETQFNRLHSLGRELYGDAEWEAKRKGLVEWVSKGSVSSSKELQPGEADALIKKLELRIAEIEQPVANGVAA